MAEGTEQGDAASHDERSGMPDGDQEDVLRMLADPASYGTSEGSLERIDTHISAVFLVGEYAFKLKRAVRFPYLDFSTPESRRRACAEELRINRRTAPELYLGARPVLRDREGRLRLGPLEVDVSDAQTVEGALDWVVVMRRFPQEQMLHRMAADGRLDCELIEALAEEVADFHAKSEPVSDGAFALAEVLGENNDELKANAELFPPEEVEALERDSRAWLRQVQQLLDRRARDGYVRRCHGDLHLRNIVLLEGRPRLFDAIEFDPAMASIDVLYDLAFLVMDLDCGGFHELANRLLNRYLQRSDDLEGLAALPLFLSLRAAIRAKVQASAAAAQCDNDKSLRLRDEARRLFAAAHAYLHPAKPQLIAIGGVSGTGKTTVARQLAPTIGAAPGALVVRSDVERKRLYAVAETERLPEEAYQGRANARVYDRMLTRARRTLSAGHSVVMEATFLGRGDRRAATRLAEKLEIPFAGLWLTAPDGTLKARVAARHGDASDATPQVVEAQLARAPRGAIPWPAVDAGGTPEEAAARAREILLASGQITERAECAPPCDPAR